MTLFKNLAPLTCALLVVGCGDDNASPSEYFPPSEYVFDSRTNLELSSSVSNHASKTQFLLKEDLLTLIRSSGIKSLSSAQAVVDRLERVFDDGVEALQTYDIYTGSVITPTPISLSLDSGYTLLIDDYSEINTETNLFDSLPSESEDRQLPNTILIEVEEEGDVTEELVGEFIGWPMIADVVDGDEMAGEIVGDLFAKIGEMSVDGDDATGYISEDGIHYDLLLDQFLLGAINYSLINQYNLIADKGLLSQNADPVNLSTILEQEADVEAKEALLEGAKTDLETVQESQETALNDWVEADPVLADPTKDLEFYTALFQYEYMSLAESYYDAVDLSIDQQNKVELLESRLEEAKEKVEAHLPYTLLANVWDESFGYFGAARNYGLYTDSEIASKPDYDENGDGFIDVYTELNTAFAVLASERDAGAALGNTDFSGNIWNAFLFGREIIQHNHGREPKEFVGYHNELKIQADIIIENLEKVLAASVIHNINKTIGNIDEALIDGNASEFDSNDYSYFKSWSTLKGMALGLQFNDAPIISKADLVALHEKIGESPTPENNNLYGSRKFNLQEARDILQQAYGFDAANVEAW